MSLRIEAFGDRVICIGGIGKMFYQDGFPVSISVQELQRKGVETSVLHIADECLKNGWSPETTFKKLREDFADSGEYNQDDADLLHKFCFSSYEDQREMIFQFLFGASSKSVIEGKSIDARRKADQVIFMSLLNKE